MIFKIRNRKVCLLALILVISTGLATIIQFVKGELFESALGMSTSNVVRSIIILGILIASEVFFYYIEWRYENYLTRETIAEQKKSILNQVLHIRKFDTVDKEVAFNSNLLVNIVDDLEYDYYFCYFESIYLILRIVFITIAIMFINIYIGLGTLLFLFIPLLVTRIFKQKVAKMEKKFAEQKGYSLELYKNIFDNLKHIRIFNAREFFFNNVKTQIDTERRCGQKTKECRLTINALYSFLSYALHFMALIVSIVLICNGKIGPGMVITLLGLTEQLSLPVISLEKNITSINSTQSLRNDIALAMELNDMEDEPISFEKCLDIRGLRVEVGSQCIRYKDIQFIAGKKYMIKGRSGVGKSVFLNAITGLISSSERNILYDGVKLKKSRNPLNNIFFVMADDFLFKKSGVYNVLLKEECTNDELNYIKKFVSEEQLYTENATKLSTGEKRRLLNLRGLMSNKDVLIFDEPVANMDQKNSELFWKEILSIDKTIIVVSHDIPEWVKEKFDEIYDFKELAFCEKIKE